MRTDPENGTWTVVRQRGSESVVEATYFETRYEAMNLMRNYNGDMAVNWAKCWCIREPDKRYIFEAEFQRRT